MANATESQLSLDLYAYQDCDDEDTVFCKTLLQELADGTKEAAEAALELDTWITSESTRRLEKFRSQPHLVEEGTCGAASHLTNPNASSNIDQFFVGFPSLCAIFPPYHAGQDRVIAFLQALMALPVHYVPDHFLNFRDLSIIANIVLWPRGVIDPDTFRRHLAHVLFSDSGVKSCTSEHAQRWRNYQSALARITMTGFSDCSCLSDLPDLLPQSRKKPLPTHKIMMGVRPADIGGRLIGAVQWIDKTAEAQWVCKRCSEKEKTDKKDPWDVWSKENWAIWKQQLEFYLNHDMVESAAKEAVARALDRMKEAEA